MFFKTWIYSSDLVQNKYINKFFENIDEAKEIVSIPLIIMF